MRIITLVALAALLLSGAQSAHAQSAPKKYLSAASNNATVVYGRSSLLNMVHVENTTATIYYVKFYNKATAPTCGTDVPVLTIPAPASATGGAPVVLAPAQGMKFGLGVGFCIVAGIADNDNTNAATGVAVNVAVTGQ